MIFISLLEGRAPVNPTYGVSRFNTRLSFFTYEVRKRNFYNSKGVMLVKSNNVGLNHTTSQLYVPHYNLSYGWV